MNVFLPIVVTAATLVTSLSTNMVLITRLNQALERERKLTETAESTVKTLERSTDNTETAIAALRACINGEKAPSAPKITSADNWYYIVEAGVSRRVSEEEYFALLGDATTTTRFSR